MNKKKLEERLSLVRSYTITGVPDGSINRLFKELGLSEKKYRKWANGQTCAIVGNEVVHYPWDIEAFIKGLAPLD